MVVKLTLVGKVIEFKLVQFAKAFWPMVSTESGMVIEVKLVQYWKAFEPMVAHSSFIAASSDAKASSSGHLAS